MLISPRNSLVGRMSPVWPLSGFIYTDKKYLKHLIACWSKNGNAHEGIQLLPLEKSWNTLLVQDFKFPANIKVNLVTSPPRYTGNHTSYLRLDKTLYYGQACIVLCQCLTTNIAYGPDCTRLFIKQTYAVVSANKSESLCVPYRES